MKSFLGVPIRVRGEVFGNLYLTERRGGVFTAIDEQLVKSLAAVAATAIDSARIYEQSQRNLKWSQASAEVTRQLLSDQGERPLDVIARRVLELADADLVVVVQPDRKGGPLRVEVACGAGAARLMAMILPAEEPLAGSAITTRNAVLVDDANEASGGFMYLGPDVTVGPAMAIPLFGHIKSLGALIVGRVGGRQRFTRADLEMASSFANHAAVALELAEFRADHQKITLLEDRDRIARDLHDHVIQRLFAAGLTVQRVASASEPGADRERLDGVIDSLDGTIRQIRASIFDLRGSLAPAALTLRELVVDTVAELATALGFAPNLDIDGLADPRLPLTIADDIEAVVREGLTNTARHAHATTVDLVITVTNGWLTIDLRDNGVGMTDTGRRSGLGNLRTRAENRGGKFIMVDQDGLRLRWTIPLR